MSHLFDPGYGAEPFRTLCAEYPDASVYPAADFRVEWGPIFHRGRLDGSARVLVPRFSLAESKNPSVSSGRSAQDTEERRVSG